ncbi:uncharacterized protein J8A68_004438 [[Candida] subhashii]|uniref:Uncharacterized protein n=1 Tax=[Candida] subhashii TaxID=561895 RepID=A0A8J5QSN7_9ASCO|nr:uncharacterized protein J8A68_004438 [[Candida] subhashii]KAG7662050.1 hypothetical protein J8A68_004438 [[Candida] subhashii]
MVAKGSFATPAANESHPAHSLNVGTDDQIQSLLKLTPIILPNHQEYQTEDIVRLRQSYKYLYVINWLYNFRGFIKLQSELFDVDLFELELLNYFPDHYGNYESNSQQQQQQVLFIHKLKINLISTLQNSKLSSMNNFEKIFRLWFGNETPLGGKQENEEDDEEEEVGEVHYVDNDDGNEPKFDELRIADKFEILYIIISYISNYSKFRDWMDKTGLTVEQMRVNSAFQVPAKRAANAHSQDEYFLLFDDNRLYKRTIHYNSLIIPKKRKLAPEYPEDRFPPESFDIKENVEFELIYKNIYECNDYFNSIKKLKSLKPLYTKVLKSTDNLLNHEIRKRKFIQSKRREIQLVSLLATRKRSSRLEAKEKQRQEELEKQKEQEELELKLAAEKRMERRRRLKEQQQQLNQGISNGLSREDRARLRALERTPNFTPTPEVITVENSDVENEHHANNNEVVDLTESPEAHKESVIVTLHPSQDQPSEKEHNIEGFSNSVEQPAASITVPEQTVQSETNSIDATSQSNQAATVPDTASHQLSGEVESATKDQTIVSQSETQPQEASTQTPVIEIVDSTTGLSDDHQNK